MREGWHCEASFYPDQRTLSDIETAVPGAGVAATTPVRSARAASDADRIPADSGCRFPRTDVRQRLHSETPVSEDHQAIRSSQHQRSHSTGAVWCHRAVCCLTAGRRSGCWPPALSDKGTRPFQVKRSRPGTRFTAIDDPLQQRCESVQAYWRQLRLDTDAVHHGRDGQQFRNVAPKLGLVN